MEYGKCVKCEDDVGPYAGATSDDLCKQCRQENGSAKKASSYLPRNRMRSIGGWEKVFTSANLQESRKWQDEIDQRLDRWFAGQQQVEDDDDNCAGVGAKLPKTPLIGSEHKKLSQIGNSAESSAE